MAHHARSRRESRVIAAVACPQCGAPREVQCRLGPSARAAGKGRLLVHAARRHAWQAWKRTTPVGVLIDGPTLIAQTDAAWTILDALAPIDAERDPTRRSVAIHPRDMRDVLAQVQSHLRIEQWDYLRQQDRD